MAGPKSLLKSIIIIGILCLLAVAWSSSRFFISLGILNSILPGRGPVIENQDGEQPQPKPMAAPAGSDAPDLIASEEIDWSMLYGDSQLGRAAIAAAISEASRRHRVSPDLLRAVIMTESVFNQQAVSRKGAIGLMQLMPDTARSLGVADPYDPRENILGGAAYLAELLLEFDGNVRVAVAAYNLGPGTLRESGGKIPEDIVPYVNRVIAYYRMFGGGAGKQ